MFHGAGIFSESCPKKTIMEHTGNFREHRAAQHDTKKNGAKLMILLLFMAV
jgi:hypothetical protein